MQAPAPRWLADARRTRLSEPPPVARAEDPAGDHECAAPARAVRSSSRAGAAAYIVAGAWHRLALSSRLLLLGLRRASQHPARRRLALPTGLALIMCMATLLSTLHSTGEVLVSTYERAAAPPPQASPTPGAARAALPPPPPPPPAAEGAAQRQHVAVAIRSIHSGLYWQVVYRPVDCLPVDRPSASRDHSRPALYQLSTGRWSVETSRDHQPV